MTFISIIRFFEYCGIELTDTAAINMPRIKKQITAEFALVPNGILEIEGIVYNKQDVFDIIEAPDFLDILSYQRIIDAHEPLRLFLEQGIADDKLAEHVEQLKQQEGFVRYLSKYFAPLFNREMKRRLSRFDFESAANWIPNCQLLLTTDGEQAFQSTTAFLAENLRLFKNLNKTTFLSRKAEVSPWTGNWARFMNWLPDILFTLKEELAVQLINFCVEIQNTDVAYCYLISQQMVYLDYLDAANTQLIRDNHVIYESKAASTSVVPEHVAKKHRKKDNKTLNYIWIAILAFFIITRFIGGCDKTKSGKEDFKDYNLDVKTIIALNSINKSRTATPTQFSNNAQKENKTPEGYLVAYLAFLNDPADTSQQYTLRIKNKSGINLSIQIPFEDDLFLFDLEIDSSITISKGALNNIDMLVIPIDSTEDNVDRFNIKNNFYLAPKNLKTFNNTYNDTGFLHLQLPEPVNILDCELQIINDRLVISGNDFKVVQSATSGSN
ncbi:MAG: hypothetical protein EOP54_07360 [Sphingobacteriales bacterium]|nr:MAG: hypothetical protein EOP54_07360 [Sphingobacteriales bacterium]